VAPRVLHLSTFDANGGAARAATALHVAMRAHGIDSRMRVGRSDLPAAVGADLDIAAPHPRRFRLTSSLDHRLARLERSPNRTWRSPARFGSLTAREINAMPVDVVNLHWVTGGFLTVETIAAIDKPIVWSHVDMWPFCGTEHYAPIDGRARWRTGYTPANQPSDQGGIDLDRRTWQRKRAAWRRPMHLAPASTWLANAAAQSALMGGWPSTRIPHVIDTEVFRPADRAAARVAAGLDPNAPILLFLSSGGITDGRKGWDLLDEALAGVREHHPDLRIVIAGPKPAAPPPSVHGLPITWAGSISDDTTLAQLYAAADVVAVPSREDNMPLTAMEAMSAGRPVVAFAIGGLVDIVGHHRTGFLAAPFDIRQLAVGLMEALADSRHANHWGAAARQHATANWSASAVVPRYLALYEQVLA
jgi:glycosyltransferase involved in cell wall biosynthesis